MDARSQPKEPVLTPALLKLIEEKLRQAIAIGYADITLEIKNGRLAFIRGPAPIEKINH